MTRTIRGANYVISGSLKVGALAAWRDPRAEEGEEDDLMRIVELNGDRALVEHHLPGLPIKPTRVVLVRDLVSVSAEK